jgi:hypothetical protein
MSGEERTGKRDLTYSKWHRRATMSAYIGRWRAENVSMIDIDCCEYCWACGEPLALVETQRSNSGPKEARVTSSLAVLAGIDAYSVSYRATDDVITGFSVRQLVPQRTEPVDVTPEHYARWLWTLREAHRISCQQQDKWRTLDRLIRARRDAA